MNVLNIDDYLEKLGLEKEGYKKCTGECNRLLPYSHFYKGSSTRRNKDRLHSFCRDCCALYSRQERLKGKWLERKFGITKAEFEFLLEVQNNCCGICGRQFNTKTLKPHVDHCHRTNKVRGLLCMNCNTKLGWFEKYEIAVIQWKDVIQ